MCDTTVFEGLGVQTDNSSRTDNQCQEDATTPPCHHAARSVNSRTSVRKPWPVGPLER